MTNSRDLLIEIGTEELPPKNLKALMLTFAGNVESALRQANFQFDDVTPYATPRRLAVQVAGLADEQPTQLVEKRGPALAAAVDDAGQATKAAQGFMRSCGVEDINDLEHLETEKGTYLVYRDSKPGQSLASMIETLIIQALKELPIERRMRWGDKRHEFVRPVHWLIVMHGYEVLPCSIFGIGAANVSRGHRFMGDAEVVISGPAEYLATLEAQHVFADFNKRRDLISSQLDAIATREAARVVIDDALLDEVTALVEWPVALMGKFPEEFLKVPEQALISAMKEHQRYFHMTDAMGNMLARFITISNIESSRPETVISGNEKVILPRLTDARFFLDQDKKTTLEDKRERLGSVIFQSKLGTYLDKTDRVTALASSLAAGLGANTEDVARGASLCKSDLVSDMVNEFPDLQGLMGGYYAEFDGESDSVIAAITDHYKPTSSGGELPQTVESKCVAIADKLDTLVGMFGIGQPPSGSRDPFALRRQTLGIIRMCIEGELDISLDEMLAHSIKAHDKPFDPAPIRDYIVERLKNWYQEQDLRFDNVDSAVAVPNWSGNLHKTHKTILALEEFRKSDQAEALIAANKRVANILKKQDMASVGSIDPSLFAESEETELAKSISKLTAELAALSTDADKLSLLGGLKDQVDLYFDKVMVMADDETLRNNRIATLASLRGLFLQVADISLLQQ